jgi:hypothetical protein
LNTWLVRGAAGGARRGEESVTFQLTPCAAVVVLPFQSFNCSNNYNTPKRHT